MPFLLVNYASSKVCTLSAVRFHLPDDGIHPRADDEVALGNLKLWRATTGRSKVVATVQCVRCGKLLRTFRTKPTTCLANSLLVNFGRRSG